MKRTFFVLAIASVVFASCGNAADQANEAATDAATKAEEMTEELMEEVDSASTAVGAEVDTLMNQAGEAVEEVKEAAESM